MGNCQAIDNATLVIQHPSGKVDKLYWPAAASEIMKMNPGHYVALLLTTTLYSSAATTTNHNSKTTGTANDNTTPLRITRIKLLRPTDTPVLGHVYRLVAYQEVMKGLWTKKQAKMKQQKPNITGKYGKIMADELKGSDFEAIIGKPDMEKTKQAKHERHGSRNTTLANSAVSKSRAWQPSLESISEAGS